MAWRCSTRTTKPAGPWPSQAPGRVRWFSLRQGAIDGCFVADRGLGRQIYLRRSGLEIPLCPTSAVQLRGEHNLQNVCAAAAAAHRRRSRAGRDP